MPGTAERPRETEICLISESGVLDFEGERLATGDEPWMRLDVEGPKYADRWVEMVYEAGLLEAVARPVLRCFLGDAYQDSILPGPVLGRAIWLGKIPRGTTRLCVSPTNRKGPFHFRIRSLRAISVVETLARGRRLRQTWLGLGYAAIGREKLSERMFRRSLMATPIENYSGWRDARKRPPEWSGIDRLAANAGEGPHIRIMDVGANASALTSLRNDLTKQPWPKWSLLSSAPRASDEVVAGSIVHDLVADLAPDDLLALARPNENWLPEAWAVLGSAALRQPDVDVFYADEELSGRIPVPRLKPGWSPILSRGVDLVGRAWIARVRWVVKALGDLPIERLAAATLDPGEADGVAHVARILLVTPAYETTKRDLARPAIVTGSSAATIIIPTRDRADLLRACVGSLRGADAPFELVVVDNGSTEEETRVLFEEISKHPHARILSRPGPFNYAALCNAAASEARSGCLVFLNNDTEAVSRDWLSLLVGWTKAPTVGAVGAKLLYPDGRIQHAGVLLGIDGHANHYERLLATDARGYFDRLQTPHEISAVTGACIAVAREKFLAVGGFDATNLPVEFNDIDLCLRLSERGFGCVLEPRSVLIHRESASRKKRLDQEQRYAAQVAYFKQRWLHRLRADPYFHPALSLSWHAPALD